MNEKIGKEKNCTLEQVIDKMSKYILEFTNGNLLAQ